jgi:N-acetyl-gamma-glutamyl-phosphate reductase/acetylglutamate kinase
MDALAIVLPPNSSSSLANLATFTITKSGCLTNVADNVFAAIKKDHPKLVWTVKEDDENLTWFFDKAEGSFSKDGEVMFWYGVETGQEVTQLMTEFTKYGRSMLSEANPEAQLHKAARAASGISASVKSSIVSHLQQARAFSTSSRRPVARIIRATPVAAKPAASRGYATTTNPNSLFGSKNSSNTSIARVALIGARGYTGQALINLLNGHPNMDLRYVLSRELTGQKLKGYDKRDITYENLTLEDVRRMEEKGEVDCWVMALPNSVCKPFVDAVNDGKGPENSVIVDLSADYRFDNKWTYGLPELINSSIGHRVSRYVSEGGVR